MGVQLNRLNSFPVLHDDNDRHTIKILTWYSKRLCTLYTILLEQKKVETTIQKERAETKVKQVSCNELDKERCENRGGISNNDTDNGLD